MSKSLVKQNAKRRKYCELRIESYELISKIIEENTNVYDDQLEDYHRRLNKEKKELQELWENDDLGKFFRFFERPW